jgi:hypothetical protein
MPENKSSDQNRVPGAFSVDHDADACLIPQESLLTLCSTHWIDAGSYKKR